MTSEHTSIKMAYEEHGMMPDEIALDRGLELPAVKACLMQISAKYRRDCGKEPEGRDQLNFTEDDITNVNAAMLSLALGAESEKVRLAACEYIRDDFKGRRDRVAAIGNAPNNIFLINQQIAKVREVASAAKRKLLSPGMNNATGVVNV